MKNILLTFDYELFLGDRSGSVENCLIKPTELILDVLTRNNAKAVFFIDTTYLFRLNELAEKHINCKNDLENIVTQLTSLVIHGHYIFHHLHPHWLDAIYLEDENQWDLSNNTRFSFNDISKEERQKIFEFSYIFLKQIYSSNQSEINPDGYRAGGLFIEPFSNFIDFFKKYDIRYEFSVVPGFYKEGDTLFYDFRGLPSIPFSFSSSFKQIELDGEFKQFPISVIQIKNLYKIFNGLFFRLFKNNRLLISGDGKSVSNEINKSKTNRNVKITDRLVMTLPLSVELLNPIVRIQCNKMIRQQDYINFLSHPKLISKQSILSFDCFLKKISKKYDINFDFKQIEVN
jgi:hypothetical protein